MDILTKVKKFIKFAVKEIGIEKMVNVKLTNSHDTIVTTAHYQPGVEIMIYVKNRAMVDVFRSIAHEMQHHKQFEEGRLIGKIQDIGGEIEDEANAVAGILIKKYALAGNKQMYVESVNKKTTTNIKIKKNKHGDYDLEFPMGILSYDELIDINSNFNAGEIYGVSYDYGTKVAKLSISKDNFNELKEMLPKKSKDGSQQLDEDPAAVIKDDKAYKDGELNTYPFYYYYGGLYVGNEGGGHEQIGLDFGLVEDCLPDDPTPEEEEEAEENNWGGCRDIAGDMTADGESTQFNGRIFETPKIISFWSKISKENLLMVINDLNNEGFNIDGTWSINYVVDDDEFGINTPIGEYTGHKASKETVAKAKQAALNHVKGKKNRGGEKPIRLSPKSSNDRYRIKQMLRQNPGLNVTLDESINEKDLLLESEMFDKVKNVISNINTKEQAQKVLKKIVNSTNQLSKKSRIKILTMFIVGVSAIAPISSLENDIPEDIKSEITSVSPETKQIREISPELVNFLAQEEGSVKFKGEPVLKSYMLGDGTVTVGYGHSEKIKDSNIKDNIKPVDALVYLKNDVKQAEDGLNRILDDWDKKDIPTDSIDQNKYNAMVSMIFNMGIGNFRMSKFIQHVKRGEMDLASNEILNTAITYKDKDGQTHKSKGLQNRRKHEQEMFTN